DVVLGVARSQYDEGDPTQGVVALDEGQDLPAVDPRQIEVEEDQVRAGGVRVLALLAQEGDGGLPVVDYVELVEDLRLVEGLAGHHGVARIVLHQQQVDAGRRSDLDHRLAPVSRMGRVKQMRVPVRSDVSSHIRPPWKSTIFWHRARPMPVPG